MSKPEAMTAYIGIGSNLDDPQQQVRRGLQALKLLPDTVFEAHSKLYQTEPVGPQDQPDYVNAVARLRTTLTAEALLDTLQMIEQSHHRVRHSEQWGPRTLDLDLLLYGQERIRTPRLEVPHPRMAERAFVLVPLSELVATDLLIPGMGSLRDLLKEVSTAGVRQLS